MKAQQQNSGNAVEKPSRFTYDPQAFLFPSLDGLAYKMDKSGFKDPNPATGDLREVLVCTQNCMGEKLVVTSTSEPLKGGIHGPDTPHGRGEAADLRLPNGKADASKALQCAANCGARAAFNEYAHPSPHATALHLHIQIVPTPSGGRGDLPDWKF